ncbi:unnamed protein product [Chrysoparadoxa australica]
MPTLSPTQSPTPALTEAPTPQPTMAPTPAPTPMPTPSPTQSPTPAVTEAPTPQPTAAPTPAPTPMPCHGKHQYLKADDNGRQHCIECPEEKSIVSTHANGPVCVLNDKGGGCDPHSIEWHGDSPVCLQNCTSHAIVWQHGVPSCLLNEHGKPCKHIEWESGRANCFDFCPAGAVEWEHGKAVCLTNKMGKKCKHIEWGSAGPRCFDDCKGKVHQLFFSTIYPDLRSHPQSKSKPQGKVDRWVTDMHINCKEDDRSGVGMALTRMMLNWLLVHAIICGW